MWDQAQVPAMKKIFAAFHNTHPDISVQIQVTPWDDYWTKLRTAATGGSAPDVFWMTLAYFQYYAKGGALAPLDDQIKQDNVDMTQYVSAIRKGYEFDGKTYGMPRDVNAMGLFYNKKLFKEAGVGFPDDSWTWQDVTAAARKLTDTSKGVYGIVAPEVDELGWFLTIPEAGGYVISPDGRHSGYSQPEDIKGIQFWVDLVNKYHASPNLQQMTDTDPLSMFTSGKAAMYYGGSWDPVAIAQVPYAKANVDVAALPHEATRHFYSNGLANSIYARTEHPKEAWQLVEFLGSKQAADIEASTGTVIPAYKGETGNYVKSMPWLHAQNIVKQLPYALPFPNSVETSVWRDYAIKEFAKVWTGKETVPQAAVKVNDQMNQALADERK
jgi:multiple sugar transport system substrate-binding protein